MWITNLADHELGIQYNVFELQEKTLLTSGVLQELQAVWGGQSFEIYECLQDVKALQRELEVCWFDLFFFACRKFDFTV